jgi:SlyX protein
MNEHLEKRLHTVEIHQAFQEDVIEALQTTVVEQHQQIQTLQNQIRVLSEYLKTLREESIRDPAQDGPPPHY